MSRIGKEPVKLADGVTATIAGRTVTVKGTLGATLLCDAGRHRSEGRLKISSAESRQK